ncbi:MAG: hypothetical protein AAGA20_21465, partial [Planctomycetota bacterium]
MHAISICLAVSLLAAPEPPPTAAEEAPLVVSFSDLDFDAESPALWRSYWLRTLAWPAMLPRIDLESGDALIGILPLPTGVIQAADLEDATIALEIDSDDLPIRGTVYVPALGARAMEGHPFVLEGDVVREDAGAFRDAQAAHYAALRDAGLPGAAWFRHRAKALGASDEPVIWTRRGSSGDADTFAMFTGGRAVSENLRLDDVIAGSEVDGDSLVPIDRIGGVRVPEMQWGGLVDGLEPKLDPLTKAIPADQHAVLFPSFAALVRVADQLADESKPFVHLADGRAQDALVRSRYETQLCVSLDGLTRRIGGAAIRSAALTGSDPYLRTGSDVALLLEGEVGAIGAFVEARMRAAEGAEDVETEVAGRRALHVSTVDRRIDSWLVVCDDLVVITNSKVQLERVLAAHRGDETSLDELPETTFFRDRYPLGDEEEDALLIVSDAAIRRWAGPKWRIASARRTRVAALLADADAWHVGKELGLDGGPWAFDVAVVPGTSGARWVDDVQQSIDPVYGTRQFLTPIVELEIDRVTAAEKAGYESWRRGYEASWGVAFDPLAVRISARDDGIEADLSILPLTVSSQYRWMSDLAGDAELPPRAGDPHEGTIFHWVSAIDHDGSTYANLRRTLLSFDQNDEIGIEWLGDHVALWLDEDPEYFERVADADSVDVFTEEFLPGLPFGLYVDVDSALGVAAFLTGARAFAESAVPGLLAFETREHADQKYVAIVVSDSSGFGETPEIYYAVLPGALCLSFSERVVQGAIERAHAPKDDAALPEPWAGRSAALRIGGAFRDAIAAELIDVAVRDRLRARSWLNLPILNEYRRLGIADPVAYHERRWGVRIVCPGGGSYAWNDDAGTMESSVYGHPAAPKDGPLLPPALEALRQLDFGLDFETFAVTPPELREGERRRR